MCVCSQEAESMRAFERKWNNPLFPCFQATVDKNGHVTYPFIHLGVNKTTLQRCSSEISHVDAAQSTFTEISE